MTTTRLARAAILAATLVLGLVPALAPAGVAAARPNLTLSGAATYDVLPEEGRVAVTVNLTATNHLKNTATRRFFFRTTQLTVLPGTSGFRLTGGSGKPKVSVAKRTDEYVNLKLDFGANLAAGKSTTLTLTFDIQDPGGAPDRPVRISPTLVSFTAWAYATPETPGATVDVRFPVGYSASIGRGPLSGPVADGPDHERWSSGPIDAPLAFVADVVADRPTDYAETELLVPLEAGPATIVLRAWPDDPAWRDRVGGLIERALPILERDIGVPWPVDGPLAVNEALVRSTGGYAGLFDPAERRIEIAYAASDGVVLHELAHAWFNGSLVADRWAAEGFASYYAERAATALGIDPDLPTPPPDGAGAMPLNDWGPSPTEDATAEQHGYAASLDLAETVAGRVGQPALRTVWQQASAGVGAYPPLVAPDGEPVAVEGAAPDVAAGPPDWRGLLDLLEDASGRELDDLWRAVVARPPDVAALDARAAAREAYERSVVHAGAWQLPPSTRAALRAWQFDAAVLILGEADAVIVQRDDLEAAAAAAGLRLPDRLERAFEGAIGLDGAADEARAERTVVEAIVRARDAEPRGRGVGEQAIIDVGLLGSTPQLHLDAAAASLAAGDIEAAYTSALRAEAAWIGAPSVGRSRIVSTVLLVVALLLLAGLIRQHRARSARPVARPGGASPG